MGGRSGSRAAPHTPILVLNGSRSALTKAQAKFVDACLYAPNRTVFFGGGHRMRTARVLARMGAGVETEPRGFQLHSEAKLENFKPVCRCRQAALWGKAELVIYGTYPGTRIRHSREACGELPYLPGTLVLIDKKTPAAVCEAFPEGSTSFLFPHYRVNITDGDKNVTVAMSRVEPRHAS